MDTRPEAITLLANLKEALPQLQTLLTKHVQWSYEDCIYRFYHHSFKIYYLQTTTKEIVNALQNLMPDRELNKDFLTIVQAGTGKTFEMKHNQNWHAETRPIMEAFFHARYFLEMAVRYGVELEQPPNLLPSGWAAFLYLYNLR